jgi:hypothetical protein
MDIPFFLFAIKIIVFILLIYVLFNIKLISLWMLSPTWLLTFVYGRVQSSIYSFEHFPWLEYLHINLSCQESFWFQRIYWVHLKFTLNCLWRIDFLGRTCFLILYITALLVHMQGRLYCLQEVSLEPYLYVVILARFGAWSCSWILCLDVINS